MFIRGQGMSTVNCNWKLRLIESETIASLSLYFYRGPNGKHRTIALTLVPLKHKGRVTGAFDKINSAAKPLPVPTHPTP
jgi:hypothetical protein